jgi:small-conductance mechanosensitive channel
VNETEVARIFQDPSRIPFVDILIIVLIAWSLTWVIERAIPWIAERVPARVRLHLLPLAPVLKLVILIAAAGLVIPLIIEPTLRNLMTILAAAGLALGFAFKDYISSVIAGVVALYERPYRTGDWVRIGDVYGEVRSLSLRALRIVTPDDSVVTIPHGKIWNSGISNDTDGDRNLLCVTDFYLAPDHETRKIQQALVDVALSSPYLLVGNPVQVIVSEQPWYTHYQLKAYPMDGRDQFLFITDLTLRSRETLAGLGVSQARTMSAVGNETTANVAPSAMADRSRGGTD